MDRRFLDPSGCNRRCRAASLVADETGSATVETVLWLPLIFLVFGVAVDLSMVFFAKSQALRVIQDANRRASVGWLATTSDIESYVEGRLAGLSPTVRATPVIDAGLVTTTVRMSMDELEMLGLFRAFDTLDVVVSAQHMIEDWNS